MSTPDQDMLFRTLGDPSRRALFERLCREGDLTVGSLTERSGISQPAVSKHLGILKYGGLVEGRREGRSTYYRALPSRLAPLDDWTGRMRAFWHARLDRLDDLLTRMDN